MEIQTTKARNFAELKELRFGDIVVTPTEDKSNWAKCVVGIAIDGDTRNGQGHALERAPLTEMSIKVTKNEAPITLTGAEIYDYISPVIFIYDNGNVYVHNDLAKGRER